jgi:tetratricopeptide (TPR) repeat protein
MSSQQFPYDLFVSYAHRDDHDGWVEAFVKAIADQHARFTPAPLQIFFDRQEIATMDDWEHRILRGLRGSKVMLAVLSPHYFDSEYCRKEWELYLEHELDRAMTGQGIAPVYIVSAPGFEDEARAALDAWTANMRRRQYLDIREWRQHGPAMLRHDDVQRRLEGLEEQLNEQMQLAERISESPTNIPQHNHNFVGRLDEIRRLREVLALSRIGTVAVLQGLSGIGKSALAFEYAHAYAGEYPGGRFLVAAAGVNDLRVPLINLAEQKGVSLSDEERKDLDAAFLRVRTAFEQGPRSLLVLDDVDNPTLLSSKARAAWLPSGDSVHIIATTTAGVDPQPGLELVSLDALAERDALSLLERHRPFENAAEAEAARRIIARLGGHAFSVEVVGVYLWQTPDVDYQGYLARLDAEGLQALEGVAREENIILSRHENSVLSDIMEPTLARLKPGEALAIEYAALIPHDYIAIPWLRALAGQSLPELAAAPRPGYPDPWRQVERRLLGLRLLTAGDNPRLARMHRLAQDVVTSRLDADLTAERQKQLTAFALERGAHVQAHWAEREERWEIEPVLHFALKLLDAGDVENGPVLANRVSDALISLGRYSEGAEVLRRVLALEASLPAPLVLAESCSNLGLVEQVWGHLETARELLGKALSIWESLPEAGADLALGLCNLALVEQDDNNPEAARQLLLRAIAIEEEALGKDHPNLATSLSNLATIESELGHLAEARDLLQRAAAIDEKAMGPEHPYVAIRFSNLASVEQEMGHLGAARERLSRAIAIFEATLEPDHPHLAVTYSNLAMIERESGNPQAARDLLMRAIAIEEKVFSPDHPNLAVRFSNCALAEHDMGNLDAAKSLLERAVAIVEGNQDPDHPMLAALLSNLGLVERDLGNLDRAHELLDRAIAIDEAAFGPEHANTAISYSKLATIERLQGNLDSAWELLYLAVAVQAAALGAEHPRLALSQFRLAQVEFDRGNPEEAKRLGQQAYQTQLAKLSDLHPDARETARWLAEKGWSI